MTIKPIPRYNVGMNDACTETTECSNGEWVRVADVEAVFTPGVVYMPVPRCDECRWWDGPRNVGGYCCLFSSDGVVRQEHQIDRRATLVDEYGQNAERGELVTAMNFGCVQWEARRIPDQQDAQDEADAHRARGGRAR